MADETWKEYSSALRQLLARPQVRDRFLEDVNGAVAAELRVPREMSTDLKNVLSLMPSPAGVVDEKERGAFSARVFFERSWAHLTRGAFVTVVMSVAVFVVGLVLVGVAAAQSVRGDEPGTAIALGASGLAAIAASFFRSPVAQIRQASADVQRSSMILMSYTLGVGLMSKSLDGADVAQVSEMLTALTKDMVALLDEPAPGPAD